MLKYTLRRLMQAIPTLFGITLLSYMLMLAAPGGPVAALTFAPNITPQEREALAERMGVNDPIYIQYLRWLIGDDWMRWDSDGDGISDQAILIPLLGYKRDRASAIMRDEAGNPILEPLPPGTRKGILRGDFGNSFFQGRRPVLEIIGERIPATIELGLASLLVGLTIGLPIGILAAVWKGSLFDNFTRVAAVIFNALPIFWLGLLLLLLVGRFLPEWISSIARSDSLLAPLFQALPGSDGKPVLPMGGRCSPTILVGGCPPLFQRLEYLILPTFVIATGGIAGFSRFMRASMLDVVHQDYMRTASAKGLTKRIVWFKHGARNALIPIAVFLGPAITGILGGSAITETIFAWPGIGRTSVQAVTQQDYPLVMATVIFAAIATILGNILTDILLALIDPRIRFN